MTCVGAMECMRMVLTCIMEPLCIYMLSSPNFYFGVYPVRAGLRVPSFVHCSNPLSLVSELAVSCCHVARSHYVRGSGEP
jgi:hypothetical protein